MRSCAADFIGQLDAVTVGICSEKKKQRLMGVGLSQIAALLNQIRGVAGYRCRLLRLLPDITVRLRANDLSR